MKKGKVSRLCFAVAVVIGFAFGSLSATGSEAPEVRLGDLRIQNAHVTKVPASARNAPVFMTIVNDGDVADRLVDIRTTRSQRIRLMNMSMHGDLMRMVPEAAFDIAPHDTVQLKATGRHLMLMGLEGPLQTGETFTVVLAFANNGEVEVEVTVQARALDN